MTELNHETILKQGRYRNLSIQGVDPKLVQALHRFMVRLRRNQQAMIKEYHPADQMRCPLHFCVGQEAVPAALSVILQREDYLFSHHRSQGYFLAKGAPMQALLAEVYGRETGANGGKAGSQDISMSSVNFYSGAILSGAVAISVGVALGLQHQKLPRVVVAGFGESATDEGVFWEAINLAAIRRLPIVFACENNRYSTFSPMFKRRTRESVHEQARAFGVETRALFGNDVVAVHNALAEAVQRARAGGGPTLVEAFTYRWNGHVGPEDDDYIGYRPKTELDFWKANDPIELLEEKMRPAGLVSDSSNAQLITEIDKEIADAFTFAKNSSFPTEPDWEAINYDPATPLADRLLRDVESGVFNHAQADAIPGPY